MTIAFTPVLSGCELGLVWRRSQRRRYDKAPRRIPELNVILGLSGRMQYFLNGLLFQLGPRSLLIAHPSDSHFLVNETKDADAIVAAISRQILEPGPVHPTLRTDSIDYEAQLPRKMTLEAFDEIVNLAQPLIDDTSSDVAFGIGLKWWLHRTWQYWQAAQPEQFATAHPRVAFTLSCIRQNPNLAISEVARQAGVSENHLGELFQNEVGVTMGVYRTQIRLDTVKRLCLQNPALPIYVAAVEAGFSDYSSFYRAHKASTGKSPRQMYKGGQ